MQALKPNDVERRELKKNRKMRGERGIQVTIWRCARSRYAEACDGSGNASEVSCFPILMYYFTAYCANHVYWFYWFYCLHLCKVAICIHIYAIIESHLYKM